MAIPGERQRYDYDYDCDNVWLSKHPSRLDDLDEPFPSSYHDDRIGPDRPIMTIPSMSVRRAAATGLMLLMMSAGRAEAQSCTIPAAVDTVRQVLALRVSIPRDTARTHDEVAAGYAAQIAATFVAPSPLPLRMYVHDRTDSLEKLPRFGALGVRAVYGIVPSTRSGPASAIVYASSLSQALDDAVMRAISASIDTSASATELLRSIGGLRISVSTVDSLRPHDVGLQMIVTPRYQFDRAATPERPRPGKAPRYPHEMRMAGIEGSVELMFVVDETGRPVPSTFYLARATNRSFARAVTDYITGHPFQPATIGGCAVATHVRMPFEFGLDLTPAERQSKPRALLSP